MSFQEQLPPVEVPRVSSRPLPRELGAVVGEGAGFKDEKRKAVVVGIGKYQNTALNLKGAAADAKEMRDRLVEDGGFECVSLIDEEAKCVAIRKALSELLWKADLCDMALFYFSGHGFPDPYGNGYLASHDIDSDDPFVSGISMREFRDLVADSKHKQVVAMLDCCYSGIVTGAAKGGAGNEPRLDDSLGLSQEEQGRGKCILASSGKDEKSHEQEFTHELGSPAGEHAHGIFTYHLLEALDGRQPVRMGEGFTVSIQALSEYVGKQMHTTPKSWCAELGGEIVITRAGRRRRIAETMSKVRKDVEGAKKNPSMLFRAMTRFCPLARLAGELGEVHELRKEIDAILAEYRPAATSWVQKYTMDISCECGSQNLRLIDMASSDLSLDQYAKWPENLQQIAHCLCLAGMGAREAPETIDQLARLTSDRPSDRALGGA